MDRDLATLIREILESCRACFDDVVALRRDIHMHPEVGLDVARTAEIAARSLEESGVSTIRGVGRTGVVGEMTVPGARKRIALRADMDALPIQELGDPPYRSRIEGRAHMCGHDVHTASLIGAARVLCQFRDRLRSNVRFIFQPSEEKWPGGAPGMIEDGALKDVDEIYGLHAWPLLDSGQFGICRGPAFGQADHFEVEIRGRGGHAAMPHLAIDPIVAGAQFVSALQSIVARNVDPLESAVITVTRFQGGVTDNVIPPEARITGTVRTLRKEVQTGIRSRMEAMIEGMASSYGVSHRFEYLEGYPVTHNHESSAKRALFAAGALVGDGNVLYPLPPILGSEDFGYYLRRVPGCFINLGSGNRSQGLNRMCHDPRFDVDETCMIYGMALHSILALTFDREMP